MDYDPTDADLIGQLQNGDIRALGPLYERHRTMVYHAALNVTRDPQAAEDVVHDAFLRVYRYAGSFDPDRPVAPWLYWVAVHRACDWQSGRKHWPQALEPLDYQLASPASQSPESLAEKRDVSRHVRDALHSLGPSQREVMILYYLHSLSLREIAHILDCPVGTVKSRLYYGRERLSHVLAQSARRMAYEFA